VPPGTGVRSAFPAADATADGDAACEDGGEGAAEAAEGLAGGPEFPHAAARRVAAMRMARRVTTRGKPLVDGVTGSS
jgi:hypothetical protein